MFTASYDETTSVFVFPRGWTKRTKEQEWEMAHQLDVAGDKYKAEGKFESAQACYKRALACAIRASK